MEEGLIMSTTISVEDLCGLESWARGNVESGPEFSKALDAFVTLRDLMTQELSQKNLLKYLHQQMGIVPKSERGNNLLAKQSGESGIPRAILRQP